MHGDGPRAPRPRVRYNLRCVCLSCVFCINVLVLPVEVYMYEVSPFVRASFRALPSFPAAFDPHADPAGYIPLFQSLYNHTTDSMYSHDRTNVLDIVRSTLVRNLSHCDAPSSILHTHVGAFYFPQDLQDDLATLTCSMPSTNGIARTWHFQLFGSFTSTSVAWLDPNSATNHDSLLTYLFIPMHHAMPWLLTKLAGRVIMTCFLVHMAMRHYYRHIWHLHRSLLSHGVHDGSTAVRFEIFVGEPTPILVSHPLVCLFFILDIWTSAEYVGLACLRVSQVSNLDCFCLGLLFFGRMMWFSVAVLLAMNILVKRRRARFAFRSVDTMTLTVLAAVLGTAATYVQSIAPSMLAMYTWLINLSTVVDDTSGRVVALDCGYVMAVASITLGCLPAAVGLLDVLRTTKKVVTTRLRRLSSHVSSKRSGGEGTTVVDESPHRSTESMFGYSDFKQRFSMWFCRNGPTNVDGEFMRSRNETNGRCGGVGMCYGGSAYRLFNLDAAFQTQSTISQRDTDCFIFGYDATNRLVEVTRVSLVANIDVTRSRHRATSVQPLTRPMIQQSVSTSCAVGRVVIGTRCDIGGFPATMIRRGINKSPWVA
ncbi:Aste57867_14330 [Aphanomyces stellatus]|uniref:Aste57867_14330 protein n=1 Tax=Aphanomyces stellatus TaxID=120398 RepID=A0A485L1G5_9STRA|nr:hypothetical protein As57867_014276 [Aphanomyces stellatus]VFT91154.1 Aste57867_14330 [Aphanomyces stellatus]